MEGKKSIKKVHKQQNQQAFDSSQDLVWWKVSESSNRRGRANGGRGSRAHPCWICLGSDATLAARLGKKSRCVFGTRDLKTQAAKWLFE